MNNFEDSKECPKCGSDIIDKEYMPSIHFQDKDSGDQLKHECLTCKYIFFTKTKDAV